MGKGAFILGVAVGYVLGARSGRERYDQIKGRATGVWKNPRVQRNVDTAKQTAKGVAGSATQKVRERLPGSSSNPSETASTQSAQSAWTHEDPSES